MKKIIVMILMLVMVVFLGGCDLLGTPSSDDIQEQSQEKLLKEATSQTGMPAIKNFRERKLLKQILELRDQEGILTYTYIVNELKGELIFLGETIGYGIPYATQYTNPEKSDSHNGEPYTMPQADPNGLFSPSSAEGTWIMLKNPNNKEVRPVYVEPRIIVSPFPLR